MLPIDIVYREMFDYWMIGIVARENQFPNRDNSV